MPISSVNATSDSFSPGALLELFELDSRYISANGARYLFHPGVNGLYRPIVWNSEQYTPFPIQLEDFTIDGKGNPSRPKLRVSNILGYVSQFLLTQGGLVGAKLTRTRVYARYLPNENFANNRNPFGTPDPTAAYEPDVFFINRTITENPQMVEMECASPWEIGNVQLPSRKLLATNCPFVYRDGETCGYSGVPVSDKWGKLFTASAPGGYGFTLNARGAWDSGNTYAIGDWVTIISGGDFNNGATLVYVCQVAGTTGSSNNPQFNEANWIADACPHNLLGCKAHFASGPLPIGSFFGISRSSYQ